MKYIKLELKEKYRKREEGEYVLKFIEKGNSLNIGQVYVAML